MHIYIDMVLMTLDSSLSDKLRIQCIDDICNLDDAHFQFLKQIFFLTPINTEVDYQYVLHLASKNEKYVDFITKLMNGKSFIIELSNMWDSAQKNKPEIYNNNYVNEIYKTRYFESLIESRLNILSEIHASSDFEQFVMQLLKDS